MWLYLLIGFLLVLMLVLLGLGKASGEGNVYCPKCRNEDCRIHSITEEKTITYACNECQYIWEA